jgi:hypothetical protein
MSMLVVQISDIGEVHELFGAKLAKQAMMRVFAQLLRLASTQGIVVRTEPATFALLMPGCTGEELLDRFEGALGRPYSIDLESHGQDILLMPDVLARRVRSAESVSAAYNTLCRDLVHARRCESKRRDYMRQERESHSHPIPLESQAPTVYPQDMPATIRLELT